MGFGGIALGAASMPDLETRTSARPSAKVPKERWQKNLDCVFSGSPLTRRNVGHHVVRTFTFCVTRRPTRRHIVLLRVGATCSAASTSYAEGFVQTTTGVGGSSKARGPTSGSPTRLRSTSANQRAPQISRISAPSPVRGVLPGVWTRSFTSPPCNVSLPTLSRHVRFYASSTWCFFRSAWARSCGTLVNLTVLSSPTKNNSAYAVVSRAILWTPLARLSALRCTFVCSPATQNVNGMRTRSSARSWTTRLRL
mmetsp:Transcript_65816/g.183344  ORF Transcript_65816/g.183344 Transcript_65816/m.183344 type:complete len:253 (-) Transcript_65816:115-873(-)